MPCAGSRLLAFASLQPDVCIAGIAGYGCQLPVMAVKVAVNHGVVGGLQRLQGRQPAAIASLGLPIGTGFLIFGTELQSG